MSRRPPLRIAAAAGALAALVLSGACHRSMPADPPGQSLALHLGLSTNGVPVGTPVTFMLAAWHPQDSRVEWVEPGSPRVVVLQRKDFPDQTRGARILTRAEYSVISLEVGSHPVMTGEVRVVTSDGKILARAKPDVVLRMESLLKQPPAPPRSSMGALPGPPAVPTWLWVFPMVALAAALIAGAGLLWSRRPRRPAAPPRLAPPHERALAGLARLRESEAWKNENAEALSVESSRIIRTYIEERFQVQAPELTTEEFIRAASASAGLDVGARMRVGRFLEECDLVKFARHCPDRAGLEELLRSAEMFVRETVPASVPSPEPKGAGA